MENQSSGRPISNGKKNLTKKSLALQKEISTHVCIHIVLNKIKNI